MKIFVGSTNPVKINAVIQAALETWPDLKTEGFEVPSGISEQPMSDEETYTGAVNRAKAVFAIGKKSLNSENAHPTEEYLAVGLEGGVFENTDGYLWCTVWVAVIDQEENIYTANGARFRVPDLVAKLIREGKEMGPVIGELVGEADVRKKQGMIGIITNGFVDRTEEYTGICKMALGLYYGRNWDDKLKK